MSKREFTDEEVKAYLNAHNGYDPEAQVWSGDALAAGRKMMRRLVEAGWTPPKQPRFYVWEDKFGIQVRDREETPRVWAEFYGPSRDDNRRDAEEYAARRNREHSK